MSINFQRAEIMTNAADLMGTRWCTKFHNHFESEQTRYHDGGRVFGHNLMD